MPPRLESMDFDSLAGWIDDDHQAAFCAFERSARAIAQTHPRPAQSAAPELIANARAALCAASRPSETRADFSRRGFDLSALFPRTAGDS